VVGEMTIEVTCGFATVVVTVMLLLEVLVGSATLIAVTVSVPALDGAV
jgi:hypothetical protein